MKYRAIRTNQFNNHIYKQGDTLEYVGDNPPSPHFEPVTAESVKKKEEEAKAEMSEIDAVREEMNAMGASFDRRWNLKRMREALIVAKKERGL